MPNSLKSSRVKVNLPTEPSSIKVLKWDVLKVTISITGSSFSLKPLDKAIVLAALKIAPLNKTALIEVPIGETSSPFIFGVHAAD